MYIKKERTKPKELKDPWSLRLKELAKPLAARAFKEGVEASDIARFAIRKYLEDRGDIDRELMESLAFEMELFRRELSKVGGNLNQLNRKIHSSGNTRIEDVKTVQEELTEKFESQVKLLKGIERLLNKNG